MTRSAGADRSRTMPALLGRRVATTLRAGTLVSIAVVSIGYLLAVSSGEGGRGRVPVVDAIAAGGGQAVMALGLLGLTLIPIATLGVAAAAFRGSGEGRKTAVTLLVIGLLAASLAVAAVLGPPI